MFTWPLFECLSLDYLMHYSIAFFQMLIFRTTPSHVLNNLRDYFPVADSVVNELESAPKLSVHKTQPKKKVEKTEPGGASKYFICMNKSITV